jgi:ABC-type phosphate transport system substrate-binding protein
MMRIALSGFTFPVLSLILGLAIAVFIFSSGLPAGSISNATPWTTEFGFQNLTYGGSSIRDVERAMGRPGDEFLQSNQLYPAVQNLYYYEEGGTGAATVFVFENGLLVGMFYKSSENQLMDLTYFLIDNGDRQLNFPLNAGYQGFFPADQFFQWY